MEYASNAKANTAVTLGAIGTGLGALNGTGLLAGLFGNGMGNTNGTMLNSNYVSKDEMKLIMDISAKDSEIALLKSEQNTENKIADVYERIMTRVNQDQRDQAAWNAGQSVINAQISASIATNASSIAALQNCCNQITMLKIPNSAVCPGWGSVTVMPTATGTTVG